MVLMTAYLPCVLALSPLTRAPAGSRPMILPRALLAATAPEKSSVINATPSPKLEPPPPLPDRAAIRNFALPALLLWVGSPILSLIDTSAVGLSAPLNAGATQLAALGPSTTFCDGASYLFAFLSVATTNLYAGQKAKASNSPAGVQRESAEAACEDVVRIAARLALICGVAASGLLLVLAPPMLRFYVGAKASANTAMIGLAVSYVRIRILSLPFALLGNVLQSALLGARDSTTPVLALVVSAVANVVGDALCVVGLRQGVAGAALATSFAQILSTVALVRAAMIKLLPLGGLTGPPRKQLSRPPSSSPSASVFLKFAAPVLTLILGKIVCFGFMTRAAAGLGEVPLACHQLTLSAFFFLSPMLEVISQTAQTFLPEYASPPENADVSEWRKSSDRLALRLLRLAMLVAIFASVLGAALPLLGAPLLTNDPRVIREMKLLALPLCVAMVLTGPVCASEGVLLARRQLGFLSLVYLTSVALLPTLLLRVGSVTDVWTTFAVFQLARAAAFTGRVWLPTLFQELRVRIRSHSE